MGHDVYSQGQQYSKGQSGQANNSGSRAVGQRDSSGQQHQGLDQYIGRIRSAGSRGPLGGLAVRAEPSAGISGRPQGKGGPPRSRGSAVSDCGSFSGVYIVPQSRHPRRSGDAGRHSSWGSRQHSIVHTMGKATSTPTPRTTIWGTIYTLYHPAMAIQSTRLKKIC